MKYDAADVDYRSGGSRASDLRGVRRIQSRNEPNPYFKVNYTAAGPKNQMDAAGEVRRESF